MRTTGFVIAAYLYICPVFAQTPPGAVKPITAFRGHILPNDRDFVLTLMNDGSANAEWIGSAGRRFEFGGFYTVTGGSYEVSLKGRDPRQFYQTLNLSIRVHGENPRGEWTSERQKRKQLVAELKAVVPESGDSAIRQGAKPQASTGKPFVGVIRTGARARAASAAQAANARRTVKGSFRSASKRLSKAYRRVRRR